MKKKRSQPSYPTINMVGKVTLDGNEKRIITLNAPAVLQHFLQENSKLGDDISLKIVCKRPKRTLEQNNFFHLYLSLISISSGHTMAELKNWYKGKFLSKGIKEVFGEKTRITKSSADLNISELCELMNKIEEKTAIPIPDPSKFNLPLTIDEYGKLKSEQRDNYRKMKANKIL